MVKISSKFTTEHSPIKIYTKLDAFWAKCNAFGSKKINFVANLNHQIFGGQVCLAILSTECLLVKSIVQFDSSLDCKPFLFKMYLRSVYKTCQKDEKNNFENKYVHWKAFQVNSYYLKIFLMVQQ